MSFTLLFLFRLPVCVLCTPHCYCQSIECVQMSNSKLDSARQKLENVFGINRMDVDLYRDTPLRYCGMANLFFLFPRKSINKNRFYLPPHAGYSNEVGESFRPLIPKVFVHLSYAVAISYVLAECVDKSLKTYRVRNACV